MSQKVVVKAWPSLSLLLKTSKKTFAAILRDRNLWKIIVQALIEIAYNFLYEDVGLSKRDKKELGKIEYFLTRLSARGGGRAIKMLRNKCDRILKNRKAVLSLISTLAKNSFACLTEP